MHNALRAPALLLLNKCHKQLTFKSHYEASRGRRKGGEGGEQWQRGDEYFRYFIFQCFFAAVSCKGNIEVPAVNVAQHGVCVIYATFMKYTSCKPARCVRCVFVTTATATTTSASAAAAANPA